MPITTSIPATSAIRPHQDVVGALNTLGIGALVGVSVEPGTGAIAGEVVGVAADETLMLIVAVLLAAEPSVTQDSN